MCCVSLELARPTNSKSLHRSPMVGQQFQFQPARCCPSPSSVGGDGSCGLSGRGSGRAPETIVTCDWRSGRDSSRKDSGQHRSWAQRALGQIVVAISMMCISLPAERNNAAARETQTFLLSNSPSDSHQTSSLSLSLGEDGWLAAFLAQASHYGYLSSLCECDMRHSERASERERDERGLPLQPVARLCRVQ